MRYLLIPVKVIALEKVYFSDMQNRKTVNAMIFDDKHYLLNRNNFRQLIQMILSQKQKTFSELFYAFSKSILNFKHFYKIDDPHS